MVAVPSGWFRAGCAELPSTISDVGATSCTCTNPPRDVWVSAFEIDRLEATVHDYAACVRAGKCAPVKRDALRRDVPDETAVMVEFDQAVAFCSWQKKRLPTEAEWEKAARGTDNRMYPWGFDEPDCMTAAIRSGLLDRLGHTWDLEGPAPEPLDCRPPYPGRVGMHPSDQSPYGALDMAGNVPEWTTDLAVGDRIEWTNGVRDCPSVGKSVKVQFVDRSAVDPKGPSAEARERYLKRPPFFESTPKETALPNPMHIARTGAIGLRTYDELGDLEGHFFAGVRCVRPMQGGPRPAEPSPSGWYDVTMHRDTHTDRIVVQSKPTSEQTDKASPTPRSKPH